MADNMRDCKRKGRRPRGEAHGSAKLMDRQVREIRKRAARGEKQKDLAKIYQVSTALVSFLVNNRMRRDA